VGYGRAVEGTAVGVGTMVAHPVQTAKGIGTAVASPIQTGKAIMADYEGKLQSNAGVGQQSQSTTIYTLLILKEPPTIRSPSLLIFMGGGQKKGWKLCENETTKVVTELSRCSGV
jgi:hypothetical protein